MFKSIKGFLVAAAAIVAMSASSAAYASVGYMVGGRATSGPEQVSIVPSVPRATASSSSGFQWGDAAVGAAGVIVLLGAGAGAATVVRSKHAPRPIAG